MFSFALGFAIKLLIVRTTSKEEFGIYSMAIAVCSIASIVPCLGLHEGVARYIAVFLGEGKREAAGQISRSALIIGAASGLTVATVLYLCSGIVSDDIFYKQELVLPLRIVSYCIPFIVFSQILIGILRGYGVIVAKVYFLDVGLPLYFFSLLGARFFLGLPFTAILYAYLIALIMVFFSIAVYGYNKIGTAIIGAGRGSHKGRLLSLSIPILASSVMLLVFDWTDTLMLGRYASAADVGTYNVGISLARFLALPLNAMGFVFLPIAADLYGRRRETELKRSYQVVTKWVFSAAMPLFFVLFFFPEMTITLVFGGRFAEAAMPLRILAAGFLVQSFWGLNGHIMTARGMAGALIRISAAGVFINVLLNYLFIKHLGYGPMGAAFATALSYVIITTLCAAILQRETAIHPLTAGYLKPVAGLSVSGLIVYALAKSLPFSLWIVPLYLLLFIAGYGVVLFLTKSVEREDIMLFDLIVERTGVKMKLIRSFLEKACI